MTKTWLLEGCEAASVEEEASKVIRPCKLPLMCNVELDAVAASEKPTDPAFVARFQELFEACSISRSTPCLESKVDELLMNRNTQNYYGGESVL